MELGFLRISMLSRVSLSFKTFQTHALLLGEDAVETKVTFSILYLDDVDQSE